MSFRTTRESRSDPFRLLAIIGIVIGLLIVIGGAVFWAVTGRQSSLIMGAGMVLAIGGGLRNLAASYMAQFPTFEPPRPPEVQPPVMPLPPPPEHTGEG
jgi:hypothetical protein